MVTFLSRVGVILLVFVFWTMLAFDVPLHSSALALGTLLYFVLNLNHCLKPNAGRRGSVARRFVAGYYALGNRMAALSLAGLSFLVMNEEGRSLGRAFLAWAITAALISLVLRTSSDARFLKLSLYTQDSPSRQPKPRRYLRERRTLFRESNWHTVTLAVTALNPQLGFAIGACFLILFYPMFFKMGQALPQIVSAVLGKTVRGSRDWIQAYDPEVICYCSGPSGSTYQLNQWTSVLERCGKRVLVVVRERHFLAGLKPNSLPLVVAKTMGSLDDVMTSSTRVVLYPANGNLNAHMLRRPELRHIFINHGDSDKAVNHSKFLRCYDLLYLSGEMAVERTRSCGLGIPEERFIRVGRPQVDLTLQTVSQQGDREKRTVVLYAPTWEGFDGTTAYCSISDSMTAALECFLDDERFTLLFKPHPYTGKIDIAVRSALSRMRERLEKSSNVELFGSTEDILNLMNRSDLMISDVSSVLVDYLHTEKPIILTNPQNLTHDDYRAKFYSSKAAYLLDHEGKDLAELIEVIEREDPARQVRLETKEYSLGSWPQGSMKRFSEQLAVDYEEAGTTPEFLARNFTTNDVTDDEEDERFTTESTFPREEEEEERLTTESTFPRDEG